MGLPNNHDRLHCSPLVRLSFSAFCYLLSYRVESKNFEILEGTREKAAKAVCDSAVYHRPSLSRGFENFHELGLPHLAKGLSFPLLLDCLPAGPSPLRYTEIHSIRVVFLPVKVRNESPPLSFGQSKKKKKQESIRQLHKTQQFAGLVIFPRLAILNDDLTDENLTPIFSNFI